MFACNSFYSPNGRDCEHGKWSHLSHVGASVTASPCRSGLNEYINAHYRPPLNLSAQAAPSLCPLSSLGTGPGLPFLHCLPEQRHRPGTLKESHVDSCGTHRTLKPQVHLPIFSFVTEETKAAHRSIMGSEFPSQQRTVPFILTLGSFYTLDILMAFQSMYQVRECGDWSAHAREHRRLPRTETHPSPSDQCTKASVTGLGQLSCSSPK